MRYIFKFNEINDFTVNQILEDLKCNFLFFENKKSPRENSLRPNS